MNILRQFGAALVLAAAATANAAAPAKWTITDLGNGFNPAFGAVYATAVNNRGQVTGWAYANQPIPMHHAFIWENGTLTDLGVPAGSFESGAYGINNKGTVVGHDGSRIAFYADGVWTRLEVQGSANDVNDRGTIVGSYNSVGTRPFMYRDGVFMDLGMSYGVTYAVNHKDAIVGWTYDNAFHPRAWLYENGAVRDLGTLGGTDAYAFDINNHGVVVGASSHATGLAQAFIYENGAMRALFAMNHGYSHARSINDHGDITGTIDGRGFLLTRDGTLTMLESLPGVGSGGWSWLQPTSINDRGWIVGTALRNGTTRSFLLKPR